MQNLRASRCHQHTCTTDLADVLGPCPAAVIDTLADLGMTDQEIARYFHILPERITRLFAEQHARGRRDVRPAVV